MEKKIIILISIIVFSAFIASIYFSSKPETKFKVFKYITPEDYFKNKNLSTSTSTNLLTSSTTPTNDDNNVKTKDNNTCEESKKVFIYPDMPCLGFSDDAMMPAMSCGVILNNIDVSYSN
jgi:hypothetical protein